MKNFGVVIGDGYFYKNNPVPMEVLIGEDPGGDFLSIIYSKDEFNYPIKMNLVI